ncbi:MAG: hypothetical protein MR038_08285 [Oscillospiraceae bacterium]|nr:hypothetical protein [Oscillospiraceae bacterium]
MFFKKRSNIYKDSVNILTEQGYSDEYISALKAAMEKAKTPADIAEGQNMLGTALLFRGELDEAYDTFSQTDDEKISKLLKQSFAANYLLCLFLLNKFREAEELFVRLNKELLDENTLLMRRSMGIHQFIAGNYDAALTIFLKAYKESNRLEHSDSSRNSSILGFCLIRTLLKLDMYEGAADYLSALSPIADKGQLGVLCGKMKRTVADRTANKNKRKKKR